MRCAGSSGARVFATAASARRAPRSCRVAGGVVGASCAHSGRSCARACPSRARSERDQQRVQELAERVLDPSATMAAKDEALGSMLALVKRTDVDSILRQLGYVPDPAAAASASGVGFAQSSQQLPHALPPRPACGR